MFRNRMRSKSTHFPARVASDARCGGEGRDAGIGHHRRGVVLICALVCLAVATAIVLTTIRQALDARRHGRMERQLRQTEYLLDAGIRRAVAGLRGSDDYSGETWRPVGALPRMESVLVEIHIFRPIDNPSSHQVTILAKLGHSAALASQTQRSHTFTFSLPDQPESPRPE